MADSSDNGGRRLRKRPTPIMTSEATGSSTEDTKLGKRSATASTSMHSQQQHQQNEIESNLKCPVCLMMMQEPHSTICGHSFCAECIKRSLAFKKKCPSCSMELKNPDTEVFVNHTLAQITQRFRDAQNQQRRLRLDPSSSGASASGGLAHCLSDTSLDLPTVSKMISALERKRTQLEMDDKQAQMVLLMDFFDEMITRRQQQMDKLAKELAVLRKDRDEISQRLNCASDTQRVVPESMLDSPTEISRREDLTGLRRSMKRSSRDSPLGAEEEEEALAHAIMARRKRMAFYFPDLENVYLSHRTKETAGVSEAEGLERGLEAFRDVLMKMTQYNGVRTLGNLNYSMDSTSGLSIVSSIEFDRDGEYFAVAGVTKKIKLYDFNWVVEDHVDIHYPVGEMQCTSKISSVSWNPYTKSALASADYEGTVQLWDAWAGRTTRRYHEHQKRCWSVNFNNVDSRLLASGSDDALVKLWDVSCERSVAAIQAGVNVCCVHFSPSSRHHIAFGSADHCVHYYDIRNTKVPVTVFKGHKKAVSYVKFCTASEIISASTDSHLRLWNVENGQCQRILKGHQNEKNFVGLATGGDFIACGSESNNLYLYYKNLSKPLLTHTFGQPELHPSAALSTDFATRVAPAPPPRPTPRDPNEAPIDFVSAVCWKKNSNVLVAANSQGMIQILELV